MLESRPGSLGQSRGKTASIYPRSAVGLGMQGNEGCRVILLVMSQLVYLGRAEPNC
jgi:hypothetical protein